DEHQQDSPPAIALSESASRTRVRLVVRDRGGLRAAKRGAAGRRRALVLRPSASDLLEWLPKPRSAGGRKPEGPDPHVRGLDGARNRHEAIPDTTGPALGLPIPY